MKIDEEPLLSAKVVTGSDNEVKWLKILKILILIFLQDINLKQLTILQVNNMLGFENL